MRILVQSKEIITRICILGMHKHLRWCAATKYTLLVAARRKKTIVMNFQKYTFHV